MSLRWIHENLVPPNCDEESSDIDDSCSDDSYDSDLGPIGDGPAAGIINNNNNSISNNHNNHYNNNNAIVSAGLARLNGDATKSVADSLDGNGDGDGGIVNGNGTSATTNGEDPAGESLMQQQLQHANSAVNNVNGVGIVDNGEGRGSCKLKLFCRTGYYIGVGPSGRARGFPAEDTNDAHVRLILCPASYGIVRLQSAKTGRYLAFNATGHLYGEAKMSKDNTEWEQWTVGNYSAFRSHKYADAGWWLGVKRNGRHKPGPKTAWGQKAIQFLPIRLG